jgi:hypothetical protein
MKNKNIKLLKEFTKYCIAHPEERFWQALRNWAKAPAILIRKEFCDDTIFNDKTIDTFYFEGKDK